MRSRLLGLLITAAIAGIGFAAIDTASADESFGLSFSNGDVDAAYHDGWWDHHHHFHHWRHHERSWYRAHYSDDYHDWDHDRDGDRDRYRDRDRDWNDPD